jgi:hypothetical protein
MSAPPVALINCVPGLVPLLSAVLAPGPPWAPAAYRYSAVFVPGLAALAPAAHAVLAPAAVADPVLPGFAAVAVVFVPGLAALAPAAHAVQAQAAAAVP